MEELNLRGQAVDHVWQSVTSWGTTLEWVLVDRHPESTPEANQAEVSEWMWVTPVQLLRHPQLLPSVPAFFSAWARKEFVLPDRAGQPDPYWVELM
jgi:hypothetical protein